MQGKLTANQFVRLGGAAMAANHEDLPWEPGCLVLLGICLSLFGSYMLLITMAFCSMVDSRDPNYNWNWFSAIVDPHGGLFGLLLGIVALVSGLCSVIAGLREIIKHK
jgi:hypothetical protein